MKLVALWHRQVSVKFIPDLYLSWDMATVSILLKKLNDSVCTSLLAARISLNKDSKINVTFSPYYYNGKCWLPVTPPPPAEICSLYWIVLFLQSLASSPPPAGCELSLLIDYWSVLIGRLIWCTENLEASKSRMFILQFQPITSGLRYV